MPGTATPAAAVASLVSPTIAIGTGSQQLSFKHRYTTESTFDGGVVDPHLRVHGTANLHVAGAATFPTSGYANCTYTALALALRMCDRLTSYRNA